MVFQKRTRPYRLARGAAYHRWQDAHPGEPLTYRGWLEVQVESTKDTLRRLKAELAEEVAREANG